MENTILKKNYIFTNVECKNKLDAFKFIANNCKLLNISNDENIIYKNLLEREKEFTTNLGDFIAIPHTKSNALLLPAIFLVRFKNPIVWSENEEKVKICISFLMPDKSDNMYLTLLSNVSRKLINKDFKASLLKTNTIEELFTILNNTLSM